MSTTRWVEEDSNKTLEQAINTLLANERSIEDNDSGDAVIYRNWSVRRIGEKNQEITLNGRNINFTFIRYTADQIVPGKQPEIDRTNHIEGFIIPYKANSNVNYIINRNSDAQKLLRKMLGYTGRNEISLNMLDFSSDTFFWIINRVYNNDNEIGDNDLCDKTLSIEMVKGIRGDTEDSLSKVSTSGETVMNIISTLSLFLESRNLDQVKLNITYCQHDIELILNAKGRISVSPNKYYGPYQEKGELCIAYLYMLVYIEIIPNLIQAYSLDKQNGDWGPSVNISFLNNVAAELRTKVEEKVYKLTNKISS